MQPVLRPAEKKDFAALLNFTKSLNYLHRHLDWRDSLEWLGHTRRSGFWKKITASRLRWLAPQSQ
jgi:hypothetical protein